MSTVAESPRPLDSKKETPLSSWLGTVPAASVHPNAVPETLGPPVSSDCYQSHTQQSISQEKEASWDPSGSSAAVADSLGLQNFPESGWVPNPMSISGSS